MTTMLSGIRQFIEQRPDGATTQEIRRHIEDTYPGRWSAGTLTTNLYACAVNQPGAYKHHRSTEKFLFKDVEGKFHIYESEKYGPNVWVPSEDDETVSEDPSSNEQIEQLIEASISFEKDVEAHLIRNLDSIEKGLRFVDRQVVIDVGRVDIIAEDIKQRRVIIELKLGDAKDAAVGQIARYIGWYARKDGKPPRAMLIAGDLTSPSLFDMQQKR
ncbi:endonuclease NucS domain-containing protein [Dyella nitratireducens]|uniref:Endonuclease NucS C-terminal domain-containing protein n=1 Tax=Dyella nitratireducens TaxID=1849580 RepID=A0ABQ1FR23_9GAMM|nr:endonuclease NucS domain-containing protein [Dyella nitratireducens]GGA24964.1 hypothetical protein GCM10010981_11820 [Dyella nitratireducens]GLQ43756.1 hypothetical protein GCM10007902_36060 [Dyella nitratireducens]